MRSTDHLTFLVVDDNAESRMLLAKTLMRKYPDAAVTECQDADTAAKIVARETLSAVIAHRTFDYEGPRLVSLLRTASAVTPIVAVSGHSGAEAAALASGANSFLNYDRWLQIATVVGDVIAAAAARERAAQGEGKIRLAPAPAAKNRRGQQGA